MFGFLRKLWNDFVHTITAVEKWVLKFIHAIYSWVDKLFHELRRAVTDVWHALVAFSHSIEKYAVTVYHFARSIVTKYIPDVIHWALREMDKILHYAEYIARWAEKWIVRLFNDIVSAVNNLTRWIIKHIWNPLFDAFADAWHWITHEGYYVWHLLTHPELLMKVIGSYLWMSYLAIIRRYARPIARWLIHGMLHLPNEFADVLETIISNML